MPTLNIDVSSAGDNVIIAPGTPVPGTSYPALKSNQQIVVLHFYLTSTSLGGTVTAWKSSGGTVLGTVGSTDVAGGGLAVPYAKDGLFRTLPGEGLNLNLAGAKRITGMIEYAIVPGFSQLPS
jgi:hypothetical protein